MLNSREAAQLETDMRIATTSIYAAKVVADNTKKQDDKLRTNWRDWCSLKKYEDNDTVHEDKIWLYVRETLVTINASGNPELRLHKPKGNKISKKRIKESVVTAHLAALVKLHYEQAFIEKTNTHPVPSKTVITDFKNSLKDLLKKNMIHANKDRGIGSIFDGYCSQNELNSICRVAFEEESICSFRTRVLLTKKGYVSDVSFHVAKG